MPAQILPFPGQQPSLASLIALYLRIGDNHKLLAGLHASGRLPVDRAVFDASRFKRQWDRTVGWTRSRPIARQPSLGPLFRRGRP